MTSAADQREMAGGPVRWANQNPASGTTIHCSSGERPVSMTGTTGIRSE